MPNRLATESSPYLLQHARNPVDWYPWGPEALARAKAEDKPIFLSIGYAACHWCHVMAHESFEDPETAALMNRHFINIKVDREERPDIDAIYMQATVAMTQQGGWPMSVFLTPDGVPFYAGTYFPNQPRYGMPSFQQLLNSMADAWAKRRADVTRTTDSLMTFYQQVSQHHGEVADQLDAAVLTRAVDTLAAGFDTVNGGWGRAPKFPQPMTVEFLLAHFTGNGNQNALNMAEKTLLKMAMGGLYDQLGGGFHRYSTDAVWLVPHFEKMLYDNSQLARVYLHAWQLTNNEFFRRVATETLDYVAREMADPVGGFYSTQDADTEGVEGKSYVWSIDEIRSALGDEAVLFNEVYGVTRKGNFDGANILHQARDAKTVAKENGLDERKLYEILAQSRQKLFSIRSQRSQPGRDEKVLTAWNGLMLAAFAEAARVLKRADYLQIAIRNAEFVLRELRTEDGHLRRTWKAGVGARLNGYLEDYSHLAEGLLALYQTTFDERWFTAARELADSILTHFAASDGSFYDTSDDHETLITRPHELQDNAVPAGNSIATHVLLKLAAYTGETEYRDRAEQSLRNIQSSLALHPTAFGQWLCAFEFAIADSVEVAIIGDPKAAETAAMLNTVFAQYRPHQVVASTSSEGTSVIPLLKDRSMIAGITTAYVCRRMACLLPVNEPEALRKQLPDVHSAIRHDN
ncbi:MAG TPA: thioredoxin domain-containing protein [Anaerolineae bacterium]